MFAATIRKNCGVMLIIGGAEVTMEVDSKKETPQERSCGACHHRLILTRIP